jgi:hypothetical protein
VLADNDVELSGRESREEETSITALDVCAEDSAKIIINNVLEGVKYTVVNQNGIRFSSVSTLTDNPLTIEVPSGNLVEGSNHFIIEKELSVNESRHFNVSLNYIPRPEVNTVERILIEKGTAITLFANGIPEPGHYEWYDAEERKFINTESSTLLTPTISEDTEYYVVAVSASGCRSLPKLIRIYVD